MVHRHGQVGPGAPPVRGHVVGQHAGERPDAAQHVHHAACRHRRRLLHGADRQIGESLPGAPASVVRSVVTSVVPGVITSAASAVRPVAAVAVVVAAGCCHQGHARDQSHRETVPHGASIAAASSGTIAPISRERATVRPAFALCAALVAQAMACYSPDPAENLPCSVTNGQCPDGQECGADNICRSGSAVPDAAPCPVAECRVEVLATSLTSADVVSAAHPDYVFWTSVTGHQVMRTDKITLATTVVDERAEPYAPLGLVADANNVYWSDNRSSGAILSSTAAPGGTVETLATGQDFPLYMAADADNVYWGNGGGLLLRATRSAGAISMVAASRRWSGRRADARRRSGLLRRPGRRAGVRGRAQRRRPDPAVRGPERAARRRRRRAVRVLDQQPRPAR